MTRNAILPVAVFLLFSSPAARAQPQDTRDLNGDGVIDVLDVQLGARMVLGLAPCTANILGAGVCNLDMLRRVMDAAGRLPPRRPGHSVSLTWNASLSPGVVGYHIYRGAASNGPYTRVTSEPVSGTSYTDNDVRPGRIYYYVATAVDAAGNESAWSNEAQAFIPNSTTRPAP